MIEQVLPEYAYDTRQLEPCSNSRRQPDITVVCQDRIVLIEVSIVYESWNTTRTMDSLSSIRQVKLNKYNPIRGHVSEHWGDRPVHINTMIVGVRGGWIPSNNHCFNGINGLRLSKADANIIVERAVRYSLEAWKHFIGSVYKSLFLRQDSQQ